MFDGKYFEWNQRRIKGIVDFYGYKFFYMKKVLDLGCGYADMSGVLYRLGSDMTAVDARQDHLKVVSKKFPGIKVTQADLDGQWPFFGQKYDLILDLGLLCHLASYETHLKAVCASTSHLVLETAVCDSEDPAKCIRMPEGKAIYDLSYGGMGCRPSPAAIERVLTECGMTFKRVTNSKYNSGDYKYDWAPQNDDSTSLEKRALWYAVRDASNQQLPAIAGVPHALSSPSTQSMGFVSAIKDSGMPVRTTVSPRAPITARTEPVERGEPEPPPTPVEHQEPSSPPVILERKPLELNAQVRRASKEYSIVERDNYDAPFSSPVGAVIFPTTHSSKMWCKKIFPCFPGIKLFNKSLGVTGIPKSDQSVALIMCSVDNLQKHGRIWIDEWFGPALTTPHIDILKGCGTIITPSLLNAQEILKHLPQANIIRMARPWPLLQVAPDQHGHYVYLEKSEELTKLLLAAWNEKLGKLIVIGSSSKVSSNITFVSDAESYSKVTKILLGAKAIIDISENNYYQSGILKLAAGMGLPIISNNHIKLGGGYTLINQDKKISPYPTSENVRRAIQKFIEANPGKAGLSPEYNNQVEPDVRRILGV